MQLQDIVQEVKRVPGLTVSMFVLRDAMSWCQTLADAARYVAELCDRDLEWDKHGNPRFMPKDLVEVAKVREWLKRADEL
jgi:hypothetical protein